MAPRIIDVDTIADDAARAAVAAAAPPVDGRPHAVVIVPHRNCVDTFDATWCSIVTQDVDALTVVTVEDASDDGFGVDYGTVVDAPSGFEVVHVRASTRSYALRNIVTVARVFQDRDDVVVFTVDGDDEVLEDDTVTRVLSEYEADPELDVAWTKHVWYVEGRGVIPGMCVSADMPQSVDPYEHPWVTSHLRTFRASALSRIPDFRFLDIDGVWFRRGYDQALMLPLIHTARRRLFIPEERYVYHCRVDTPTPTMVASQVDQLKSVALVRARGPSHEAV